MFLNNKAKRYTQIPGLFLLMYSKQCFLCWSARKARLTPCQWVQADILCIFLSLYSQSFVMIVLKTLILLNILHFPASESFIYSITLEMFAAQQPYYLFLFLLSYFSFFFLDNGSRPFPILLAAVLDLFSKKLVIIMNLFFRSFIS